MLGVLLFADQDRITYGLGHSCTLSCSHNDNVVSRNIGVGASKVVIK